MLGALIVILIVLWFFGYISVSTFFIPNIVLFTLNGQPITLWTLLIFAIILWIISLLPAPIQLIAGLILILWLLSVLGIFSGFTFLAGLPNILILVIILGLVLMLLSGFS